METPGTAATGVELRVADAVDGCGLALVRAETSIAKYEPAGANALSYSAVAGLTPDVESWMLLRAPVLSISDVVIASWLTAALVLGVQSTRIFSDVRWGREKLASSPLTVRANWAALGLVAG